MFFFRVLLVACLWLVPACGQSRPGIQWTKGYSFGISSLESHPHAGIETSDGGFLMVGDGQDYAEKKPNLHRHLLVAKVDATGEMQWHLDVGSLGYNYGKFGIELPDGTFVISGAMTAKAEGHGELLHRTLLRVDKGGNLMQTLMLDNLNKQYHLMDGFTGITLGHDSEHAFAVTGFVGADNASRSFPDQEMFLPAGGKPCFTQVAYNSTSLTIISDHVFDDLPGCQKPDCLMFEGIRVVYDPEPEQYIVATNLYYPKRYSNEMGALALGTDGNVRWMKPFPAAHGSFSGVMSQPYALAYAPTLPGASRSYVVGGHFFWTEGPNNTLRAGGRMVGFDRSGNLSFDTRWVSGERDANIECYGLQTTLDGGFIMTCGNGVEGELHPPDSDVMKTWMVFVARTDENGHAMWSGNFSEAEHFELQNDAGEYIIAKRDGGYAVYVDSQTWGPGSTGGNFAIMMLDKDTSTTKSDVVASAAANAVSLWV